MLSFNDVPDEMTILVDIVSAFKDGNEKIEKKLNFIKRRILSYETGEFE